MRNEVYWTWQQRPWRNGSFVSCRWAREFPEWDASVVKELPFPPVPPPPVGEGSRRVGGARDRDKLTLQWVASASAVRPRTEIAEIGDKSEFSSGFACEGYVG